MSQKRRLIAQINILPFVDIVLVILIFFMITAGAGAMPQKFDVELPKITSQEIEKTENTQWILAINSKGDIYLESGSKSHNGAKLDKEKLTSFITKNKPKSENFSIYIKADKKLLYKDVLEVMNKIYESNVFKVGLVTDKKQ